MNENQLKQYYKNYLHDELSLPEVGEAKKQFVRRHFQPSARFFTVEFGVPALCLILLFVFFHHIQPQYLNYRVPSREEVTAAAPVEAVEPLPASLLAGEPVSNEPVIVKRVSSRIGPTLIYQKSHQGVPVTIIWVFEGGKS